ncbi:MAG: STAS domain-containing protein [Candidatus Methylacidiphilales bacterium]|nr:STAS domain-containing protein [Candidatus Methylacidiphilales bacterium]
MGTIVAVETEGTSLRLSVKAERLDAASARIFKQEVESAWPPGAAQVVIDLAAVAFVDSSGIGAILGIYKKLPTGGVVLTNVRPQVRTVIELLRLHRIFEIR